MLPSTFWCTNVFEYKIAIFSDIYISLCKNRWKIRRRKVYILRAKSVKEKKKIIFYIITIIYLKKNTSIYVFTDVHCRMFKTPEPPLIVKLEGPRLGEGATFECPHGYRLLGVSSITCQYNGELLLICIVCSFRLLYTTLILSLYIWMFVLYILFDLVYIFSTLSGLL